MELDPAAAAVQTRLIAYDTVDSTNASALALARAGEYGPFWLVARQQAAGRGRRGRRWDSPAGNLYASLLLTDPSPPEHAAQLSFVAALALHDALVELAPSRSADFGLKWPNDVLCGGRKVAGILIEGEGSPHFIVVIGMGVNCVAHPPQAEFPATDLGAAGLTVSAPELFRPLSGAMQRRLAQWDRGQGFAAVRADWIARAVGLDGPLRVRLTRREIEGRFAGLDADGRLILRRSDGNLETVAAGDVFPLGSHADLPAAP